MGTERCLCHCRQKFCPWLWRLVGTTTTRPGQAPPAAKIECEMFIGMSLGLPHPGAPMRSTKGAKLQKSRIWRRNRYISAWPDHNRVASTGPTRRSQARARGCPSMTPASAMRQLHADMTSCLPVALRWPLRMNRTNIREKPGHGRRFYRTVPYCQGR
jgi:hypothetical protein